MTWKAYPAYKPSGIECLGNVPAQWEVKRLKFLLGAPLKYGANEPAELDDPDLPRYVRITDIDESDGLRKETFKSLPAEIAKEYILREGDLIFARSGATAGKTFLYRKSWGVCAYAGYLIRARLDSSMACPEFIRYFTASMTYWQWIASSFIRATIQNVSAERYASLNLPLPPVAEQRAVAAFLDRETEKIDAFIAKKERLIELLQEKRTALITQAVTKGLNPNVPMKDSGVEWIERIPAMWRVLPIFTVAREKEKRNFGNQVQNVLSLSYGKIIDKDVSDNFGLLPESFETYQIVRNGDIILRLTDLQNDKRSLRVGLVRHQGIITSAYICLNFYCGVDPSYAFYLLHAYDIIKVFYSLGGGVRQTMKFEDLKWLPILMPSLEEQGSIVAFLDRETAKIDSLVIKIREAIGRLKEYRTALISAAVTGKIDVHGTQ